MPAPFLIAPLLISLSLTGTPAAASLIALDPSTPAVAASLDTAKGKSESPAPAQPEPPEAETPLPLAGVSVELECLAYPDGRVADCAVVEETRPGLGFGAAAVALMNGAQVGETGRAVPVKFMHRIQFTPD